MMNEWKPDWDQRLAAPPFKKRRFRADMMENVEDQLKVVKKKRTHNVFGRSVMVIIPALLLMLGIGIWWAGKDVPMDKSVDPNLSEQGGGTFQSSFKPGEGGDLDWWNFVDREGVQGGDHTIETLAQGLMKRELGIWGGPTPDIWEHSEVKEPLERFDVSSPWVYEVYVQDISPNEEQTVYRLRLLLRDSIPMVYEEMIDVTVRNATRRISLIELVSTDDEGTPLNDIEAGADQGESVILIEDPDISLKMTGTLYPNEDNIRSIQVQYGDREHTFADWINVRNETYYPEAGLLSTKDNDEDVLAIILTTGYGTGVRESVLKLLRNDLTEVIAADPVLTAQSRLSYDVTAEDEKRTYQLSIDGITRTFDYKEGDAGLWLDQPALGSIVKYAVEGNTLYSSIPVQVAPGEFPIAIRLRYEFDGIAFHVAEAVFEDL